jgi:DNA-binding MarR family transcriptional regulator
MAALSTLFREGPMRPTDLAAREGVRPPTMTRMLGVLEEGGYVERTNDPADRRASLIAATALGKQTVLDTRNARAGHLARHLAALDPDQRRALADALPVLELLADTDPDVAGGESPPAER